MVLLSDGCSGKVSNLFVCEIKVLFVLHDIDNPSIVPRKQLYISLSPSCTFINLIDGSKSLSGTNYKENKPVDHCINIIIPCTHKCVGLLVIILPPTIPALH